MKIIYTVKSLFVGLIHQDDKILWDAFLLNRTIQNNLDIFRITLEVFPRPEAPFSLRKLNCVLSSYAFVVVVVVV